jgi:hypothetical protein
VTENFARVLDYIFEKYDSLLGTELLFFSVQFFKPLSTSTCNGKSAKIQVDLHSLFLIKSLN